MNMADRFDLEAGDGECSKSNDIETLTGGIEILTPYTEDQILNVLIGMKELNELSQNVLLEKTN